MSASEKLKALDGEVEWRVLREQIVAVVEALDGEHKLARQLFQMISRDVWREHGAEWMGQYEGDYHAEQIEQHLRAEHPALAALDEALS